MSLELAIQANTAAIQQLIAVMSAGNHRVSFDLDTPKTRGEGVAEDPLCEDEGCPNSGTEHICVPPVPKPAEEPKAVEPEAIEPTKPLTYEADVLPVLHKFLVAKGKPAAESLLKKYAVDKFSKVPAEQLGDLLADIQKEMGVA